MINEQVRHPAVAGLFYSKNKSDLAVEVDAFLNRATLKIGSDEELRALVVPHAGYGYSGEVAAWGFAQIPEKSVYNTIILIGASHKIRFNKVLVCTMRAYETPLGRVEVDTELAEKLIHSEPLFDYVEDAHSGEHCLEVQLPFLQRKMSGQFKILPVIVGSDDINVIKRCSKALAPFFTRDRLFVISTDFSHYPAYKDAVIQDNLTSRVIMSKSPDKLIELLKEHKTNDVPGMVTGLCGWSAVLLMQYVIEEKRDVYYKHLMYQNSGDKLLHDHSRVVGYHSMAICTSRLFDFSDSSKEQLLAIAHNELKKVFQLDYSESIDLSDELKDKLGAFVSVYVQGKLRGCIGTFQPREELHQLIRRLTIDAALHDNRFEPVQVDEIDDVHFEISILGKLKPIRKIEEITIGLHGIYLKKGLNSGTLLPGVALRNNWNALEFVQVCAERKAHLGKDGWKEAEMFVYETLVVKDKALE